MFDTSRSASSICTDCYKKSVLGEMCIKYGRGWGGAWISLSRGSVLSREYFPSSLCINSYNFYSKRQHSLQYCTQIWFIKKKFHGCQLFSQILRKHHEKHCILLEKHANINGCVCFNGSPPGQPGLASCLGFFLLLALEGNLWGKWRGFYRLDGCRIPASSEKAPMESKN